MRWGSSIYQLRASGHRISDSESTGWHTPGATDWKGPAQNPDSQAGHNLSAQVAGWPTPNANEHGETMEERHARGNTSGMDLTGAARTTGWPTPTGQDNPQVAGQYATNGTTLGGAAQQAGWPTPMAASPATEDRNGAGNSDSSRKVVELMTGWATPSATDWKGAAKPGQRRGQLPDQLTGWTPPTGITPSSSSAPTGKRGALNPAFCLWLMGFPSDWLMVAPTKRRRGRRRYGD
jgi:hypothetical protein